MLRFLCFILAVCLSVSPLYADLTAAFVLLVDENDDPVSVPGFVTQDLTVSTSLDWGTAQILATLDTGTIYQDSEGSDFKPTDQRILQFPTVEFDTYLDGNGLPPSTLGAAVDVGGDVQEFSESQIDIAWFNTATNDIGNDLPLGRFTLSDDASGTWSMLITSDGGVFASFQGLINNGLFDLRPTGGGEPIPGDLNNDFFVGVDDLNIVLAEWNKQVIQDPSLNIGDINGDFLVGVDDLNVILLNWNQAVAIGDLASGDLNEDGFVGVDDLNIILLNWNVNYPSGDPSADPTGDGFVGVDDLNLVLVNWNAGTPPTVSQAEAIPEPRTLVLLGAGFISLLLPRRARGGIAFYQNDDMVLSLL